MSLVKVSISDVLRDLSLEEIMRKFAKKQMKKVIIKELSMWKSEVVEISRSTKRFSVSQPKSRLMKIKFTNKNMFVETRKIYFMR